jgi:hypothetical protein
MVRRRSNRTQSGCYDCGQASLLMLGAVGAVLVGAALLFAFGNALGAKGRYQRAADVAAISAAQVMRDLYPRLFEPPFIEPDVPNPRHLPPCRPSFAARSPGIRARRCLSTGASRSSPGSRSTSALPKAPGSGARTRTPTACFASTSRSERASPGSARSALDEVAEKLNGRPRKTLGFATPGQARRADRRPRAGRRRALISLRPTAFARQRSEPAGSIQDVKGGAATG